MKHGVQLEGFGAGRKRSASTRANLNRPSLKRAIVALVSIQQFLHSGAAFPLRTS